MVKQPAPTEDKTPGPLSSKAIQQEGLAPSFWAANLYIWGSGFALSTKSPPIITSKYDNKA